MKEVYEVLIKDVLEKKSIEYFQDLDQFRFFFDGCHGFSYVKTAMIPLEEGIQTDFYHPLRVDENRIGEMRDFLKRVNDIVINGTFELSDKGEIIYHIAIRVRNDKPISSMMFYMRLSLVQESVLFSVCSECIMNAVYNKGVDSEVLLDKLKSDMPNWNTPLDEIPIPQGSIKSI